MVNAWTLYKKTGRQMSQLDFRRAVVCSYLKRFGSEAIRPGRPGNKSKSSERFIRVSDELRLDNKGHFVIPTLGNKKIKCAHHECKSIMRTQCIKCNVGLCIAHFAEFHTKLF